MELGPPVLKASTLPVGYRGGLNHARILSWNQPVLSNEGCFLFKNVYMGIQSEHKSDMSQDLKRLQLLNISKPSQWVSDGGSCNNPHYHVNIVWETIS